MAHKVHLKLFRRVRNGTKISDAKFVGRFLELFLGWGSYENPREYQVGKICNRSPTASCITLRITFLRERGKKRMARQCPECTILRFTATHGPANYLCYKAQAQA
jgi:hypothetical protein